MICGMAAALFAADTAAAQTAPADDASQVEEVVVTGSLFRRTDTETPSPVTVMTAETLERAGIVTATDAIRSVSADSAGSIGTGFQSGFSAGGSAVSLRGLGVSSTLVLVDGLRSANFPISDDGHNSYVDLNSIPFSIIERVEVLKDGASSTYGADAIGGVVNLITKRQFQGLAGSLQGGLSEQNDAEHGRADLTFGWGDYEQTGWNFYVNAEYQRDGRVTNNSRGFPYNNRDLRIIGGLDNNSADNTLTTATPSAIVTRVSQTDLNNPLAGGINTATTPAVFNLLNPNCRYGSYTVTTGGSRGTGCQYNLEDLYNQIQPLQERYSFSGRLSIKFNDYVEGYITGMFSHDLVSIKNAPRALRATQPFGGSPSQASNNPGIVLPVYICSTGVNCATASDRRLNPNNPYAAAYANDPANGAARIYYLFGDIPAGSDRSNDVIRGTAGLFGSVDGDWNWRIEAVAARDNLEIEQYGFLNIANLLNAINTGAYNFVNPEANSSAVRNFVSPRVVTPSYSQLFSLDASVTKTLWTLPGGDMQLALGAQIRREKLVNRNQNQRLDTYTLTTSSAFGQHTVSAGYFELLAPVLEQLEVNLSGRYDHYSEGFSHFSPKVGVKWTPFRELAFRATASEGFRAPTFAESGPLSQYAGFSTYTPPASFVAAHGGSSNGYGLAYSLGGGYVGNPELEPEISKSYTAGMIAQPFNWLSFTVDYFNVKKDGLIVAGPKIADARAAYFQGANVTDACARVAAVGPGYSCNLIDAIDPLYPDALPRVLIINAPFVNASSYETEGFDFSATVTAPVPWIDGTFTSRLEFTKTLKANLITDDGQVQKYAGTLGPYQLSSGNGTPDLRGNWQNTLEWDRYQISTTTYFVDKIKSVAADQRNGTDCAQNNIYAPGNPTIGERFCYIDAFVTTDLTASAQLAEGLEVYANVGNMFNAPAPVAPAAYSSAPNFLTTFHYAGLIGRTFRLGARFNF
ncbi:TonB-dependent receptor [Phenylobacterium deserti]|uniref:TonB-dependent receptor n=2 Tax=Phenylobacterium deserti TaxID=1914756 RepID=A0A328AAJ5_9CAUL|nr:TonB-dependent receptor [Phenylobacterium deserti]